MQSNLRHPLSPVGKYSPTWRGTDWQCHQWPDKRDVVQLDQGRPSPLARRDLA